MTSVTVRSSAPAIGPPTPPTGPSPRASKAVQISPKPNDNMAPGTLLPDIRTSENSIDKRQPLPTSLQADFIPEDILMSLVMPPAPHETLGPMSRNRNLNVSMMPKRRPPASVWGHAQQREKLKYLTENPPCVCGAGRDISFLYDVPKKPENQKVDRNDESAIRMVEENEPRKAIQLPDTLIPGEYHIVKNKGVLGLEYTDDKFSSQPKDHVKHLVMFPSLNPSSRTEVKQLKKTMQEMMERLGINDLASELRGPTQMHNLIELIKKEQNIYNLVFHELIRQVSVECMDRGELLAALRDQYSQLLNRVPLQIKALHEEVMAQRALDRRLTEELMRFKSTIGILTSELADVKEHDIEVTAQASQAQEDLKNALAESQKNASLLAEYHGLYELQRKRLEKQVSMLAEEKELWSTAAYSLALKVTEEHSLNTAKRLHINEKGWVKLANHFTILLSDKDTEMLTQLQGYVDNWRDQVDEFNINIKHREDEMKQSLLNVQGAIQGWIQDFQKHVLNKDGQVNRGPDRDKAARLYNDLKSWGQLLNHENEKFGGDTLLGGQECLMRVRRLVEGWTDCSLKVFTRHRGEDGSNYPDHDEMLKMNELVDDLMSQYYVRLTGENGVATALISVTNGLDAWDNKLNALMHGCNPLPDSDWAQFYMLMGDWVEAITHATSLVGTTQKEEDRSERRAHIRIELSQVMKMTQKWLSSTTNGIDSEDAKLVEQVSTLHTEMVKWMVQLLLRLAPDRQSHSQEARDAVLEGTPTIAQLVANAKALFERLAGFSKYVALCCNGIVMDLMQQKVERHEEDADHEYRDLQRLKNECDDWITTAKLLLMELTGEPFPETPTVSAMGLAPPTPGEKQGTDMSAPEGELDPPDSAMDYPEDEEEVPGTARTEEPPTEPEAEPKPQPEQPAAVPADAPAQQPSDEVAPPLVVGADEAADAPVEVPSAPAPEPEPEDPNKMQVIGHDANTRAKTLQEQPKAEAPIDLKPPTTPGTPDPKKAFEAIAALDTLQSQLISTEERAQTAEERAAIAESELKRALETIKALERKVVMTPSESEAAERSESVATQASKAPEDVTADKSDKKTTKDKDKDKDKDKRSSSKASNKSSKKK